MKVIWDRYFNRWSPEAHPSNLRGGAEGEGEGVGGNEWHDDWYGIYLSILRHKMTQKRYKMTQKRYFLMQ